MYEFGVVQWNEYGDKGIKLDGIMEAYKKFKETTGKNYPTEEECMKFEAKFLVEELRKEQFKDIYENWKKTPTEKVAYDFCYNYENPAEKASRCLERKEYANDFYKLMCDNK
ncbi:hypothetical protein BCR32DRAFT_303039 [Anaeromyces robustus]|uniref:Phage tail lysozyme domain-containing protein n=1 Tax=Anaeromyces robustus TaxID=1754192 RepID=A0A1Y1WUU6_9FUNG|nr:hypothetical protein BCR32DRAFT_303039 [Anaeromyces robustus]|eukprot:ORX76904.1 hypothetical protein BCR32DRAFT_303039 [Anaeromyces robustus]